LPAVLLPVGRVAGVGGGGLRPPVAFGTGGFGAVTSTDISQAQDDIPFAIGGFGAEATAVPLGRYVADLVTGGLRPVLGVGRSAGAGGGAGGVGLTAGISSLR
jgi:hypothetical protein